MTETTELSELFADVAPDIQQSIRELGWHSPTPVQAAAIPKMRAGGDLIVQAQTGSGKTGAFGIPLVEAIDTASKDTQAIVLLPTRELANQVAVELEQLGRHRGVRTLPIYGGVAYGPQLEGLEKGAHIIVGTPGRILDHLKNNRMDISRTKVLVLDEADEMLSLGFWPDMKEVASFLPRKRQSHLFSATMPEKVRSLSRFFLTDAEDVTIETEGGSPQRIEHYYYLAPASEKEALLARILEYEEPESAIIFCNTKADVRFITAYLAKRGLNIDQISGDLAQAAREKAIAKIKAGKLQYLVATDVAARGIDISDLAYVINYTTSDSPEVYVHRTGRTGRAGKSGVAISIVSGLDIGNFKYMQVVSGIKITEKKAPTDRDLERRKKRRAEQGGKKPAVAETEAETEQAETKPQLETEARKEPKAESKTEPAAVPTSADVEARDLKERADKALARLDADQIRKQVDELLPFVQNAATNEDGPHELARLFVGLLNEAPTSPNASKSTASKSAARNRPAAEDNSVGNAGGASSARPRSTSRRRASRSSASRSDGEDRKKEDTPKTREVASSADSDETPSRRRRTRSSRAAVKAAPAPEAENSEKPTRRRRSRAAASGLSDDDATRAERPPRSGGDDRSGSGDRPRRRRRSSGS